MGGQTVRTVSESIQSQRAQRLRRLVPLIDTGDRDVVEVVKAVHGVAASGPRAEAHETEPGLAPPAFSDHLPSTHVAFAGALGKPATACSAKCV